MATPEEFWRQLHELADTYEHLALTTDERTALIVNQFREIVPQSRQRLLADLFRLAIDLPDLYPMVTAVERAADSKTWKRRNGSTR